MHDMTLQHLRNAHGGESMAHMRYKIWADKAEEEGFPNVARMFRAISAAEQVHATNHFVTMGDEVGAAVADSGAAFGYGTTSENLVGAIGGEEFEINEMYPVYQQTAKFQGENEAVTSFFYALSAEKIHAQMYRDAKKAVDAGKDVELGPVRICGRCGYTVEGEIPERCPICGVIGKEWYESFE